MSIGYEVIGDPLDTGINSSDAPVALVTGYCLWQFDGAAWSLKKDRSLANQQPSAPPETPGVYSGQLIFLLAVPA